MLNQAKTKEPQTGHFIKYGFESIIRNQTIKTQYQHNVLRYNKYGNMFWVNFIEMETQERIRGVRKMKSITVILYDTKSISSRQILNPSTTFSQN